MQDTRRAGIIVSVLESGGGTVTDCDLKGIESMGADEVSPCAANRLYWYTAEVVLHLRY